MRTLFLYFTVFCTGVASLAQSLQFVNDDVSLAIKLAGEEDKLIFVHGNADWCIPCKLMEEEVFIYPEVYEFFNNNFVNLSLDLESGMGKLYAARYQAGVLPFFMFLTSDETMVHSFHGFHAIQDLLSAAREALDDEKKLMAWEKRFQEGDRKPLFLYNYAFALFPSIDGSHKEVVDAFVEANPNPLSEQGVRFAYHFVEDVDSPLFDLMVDNQGIFHEHIGYEPVQRTIDLMVGQALPNLTVNDASRLIHRAYPNDGACRVFRYRQEQAGADHGRDASASIAMRFEEAEACGTDIVKVMALGEEMLKTVPIDPVQLDQLEQLLKMHPSEEWSIEITKLRGQLYEGSNQPKKAMQIYGHGRALAKRMGDKNLRKLFKKYMKQLKRQLR